MISWSRVAPGLQGADPCRVPFPFSLVIFAPACCIPPGSTSHGLVGDSRVWWLPWCCGQARYISTRSSEYSTRAHHYLFFLPQVINSVSAVYDPIKCHALTNGGGKPCWSRGLSIRQKLGRMKPLSGCLSATTQFIQPTKRIPETHACRCLAHTLPYRSS